jgi:hypothetical protein
VYKLIVLDRQLGDDAGHLRRDRHHVDPHAAVAGPWCPQVGIPHHPGQDARDRNRHKGDQQRNDADLRPGAVRAERFGRRRGRRGGFEGILSLFGSGHQRPRFATSNTIEDSTIR